MELTAPSLKRVDRKRLVAAAGDWLSRKRHWIRATQWLVVVCYAVLILVPALLPLPDETAHVFTHLTIFAQFVFWGIWWPFVLDRKSVV